MSAATPAADKAFFMEIILCLREMLRVNASNMLWFHAEPWKRSLSRI
jgi:hypothetical protein